MTSYSRTFKDDNSSKLLFPSLLAMEVYRQMYGPFPGCRSYDYLKMILEFGKPHVDSTHYRIKDLQRREHRLFYPKDETSKLFGKESAIRDIIECRCRVCAHSLRMSDVDRVAIVNSLRNSKKPKIILLAILVYLGCSYMIRHVSLLDGLHDGALSSFTASKLKESDWAELLDGKMEEGRLSMECKAKRQAFIENYEYVVNLFDLPVLSTQDTWMTEYSDERRLPFLEDDHHRDGSFGEVRKFNIHSSYLDMDEKYVQRDWYLASRKVSTLTQFRRR